MSYIYILTIIALYTMFMLIYKTEKKQNAITWLAISAILILCYNTLICVIFSFINILCTLQNLTICNSIIVAILLVLQIKNKKIQKYYLKISDIIVALIFLIVVILVAYKQYGFPFNLKYKITDGGTHYYFAEQFYETSQLLYKGTERNNIFGMYDSDFRLPGAYVNEGILFKLFNNILTKGEIFVLFDLFILYLSGILFYCLLQKYTKNNKSKIIAFIFSLMYMLGYQLNSMLYGYVYLSLALDIITAFLILVTSYDRREFDSIIILPILAILSFGIFFSYAYFIPIIYIGIIINLIIKTIQSKEQILSEENLIYIWSIIILPLILGLTFFIILPGAKGIDNEISTIGANGTIYENYITNYLVFIPILILTIIKNKQKESNFGTILFILSILFAIILFIGKKLEIVSNYYFFKAYYIIWPLAIYNAFISICKICEENKKSLELGTYAYITTYALAIIASTLIFKTNIGINHIFYDNLDCVQNTRVSVLNSELKIAEQVEKQIKLNQIYVLSPKYNLRSKWISILHKNEFIYFDYATNSGKTIEQWVKQKDERYYLAYYQDYKELEIQEFTPSENSTDYKIVYRDKNVFILERK